MLSKDGAADPFPMILLRFSASLFLLATGLLPLAHAQLNPEQTRQIDEAARRVLETTGLPSASVGIVQNDRIVYTHAFGLARLQPPQPATADMAYPIGSISKQFTAAAMLLLQQQGKLRLDDPVARFYPDLTRASEVTLRNLLTHTSGYQDYAPQDYTIPAWKLPIDPVNLVREYCTRPLDFDPGTQWQYSNTNFELAALIVQKVSGEPFAQFLREHILEPAGLQGVLDLNTQRADLRVTGYMRNALAPLRPAALEAPGWYFGDADLAMPTSALLQWDLSVINQSLLSPASYRDMETPFLLKNGRSSNYGLGIDVNTRDGHFEIEHSGEVGGFVAENLVLPDSKLAIVVLTNQEASDGAQQIARAVLPIVLGDAAAAASHNGSEAAAAAFAPQLKALLTGLQAGQVDRALLTADASAYFDQQTMADFHSSLSPLGTLTNLTLEHSALRGGMTFGLYRAIFSTGTVLRITVYLTKGGKVEQLLVVGKE